MHSLGHTVGPVHTPRYLLTVRGATPEILSAPGAPDAYRPRTRDTKFVAVLLTKGPPEPCTFWVPKGYHTSPPFEASRQQIYIVRPLERRGFPAAAAQIDPV